MKTIIVNFKNKTGIESVIDTLNLKKYPLNLQEFRAVEFFGDFQNAIMELKQSQKLLAGGGQLIAFNYPLVEKEGRKVCEKFFYDSLHSEDNLYYYPKPNEYVEVDDFAFFSLKKDLTLDNYFIECLYRNDQLDVGLRNKIHPLLRDSLGIPARVYKKMLFKESRKLFNLSYSFKPYNIDKDTLFMDLTKNLKYFYKAPQTIGISLNNTCNLSCIMCHYHSPIHKPTQSTDFFKTPKNLDSKIVQEAIIYAAKNGCAVDFTGPGEVLLDDRIYEFIKFARDKGVARVGFTSNATLLTKDRSKKLIDSGISFIRFSVDGAVEETYKAIRGASLKKVEEHIRAFIKYALEVRSRVEINLNCVLVEGVKEEMELFMQKWEDCLPFINYVNFSNEIFLDERGFHKEKMPENRYVCHWPFLNGMYIAPNGKVSICCAMQGTYGRDEVSVGDIYQETLEEIWNGEVLNTLRKECLEQKYEKFKICQSCIEWANNRMEEDGSGRSNGIVHRK